MPDSDAMRVAYVVGRYPAVSHTFIRDEVRALRDAGVEVETFSIWRSPDEQVLSAADVDERANTVNLIPIDVGMFAGAHLRLLGRRPGAYGTALRQAWRLRGPGARSIMLALSWVAEAVVIWSRCERAGIRHVHAHLNGTAPAVASVVAAIGNSTAKPGGPRWTWSMTVHGPTEFYDVAAERLDRKARDADLVVCITQFARSQLMGMTEPADWPKLQIVRCGITSKMVRGERSQTAPTGPVKILTVGRLVPVKGQGVLLEACAALAREGTPFELVVVGDGPERESLAAQAQRLGIADRVDWRGAIGHDEIGEVYAQSDLFCLASFAEGLPVVIMEAMAMRLPVVASRIMGIPELVTDGESGLLVTPGDVDELASALTRLAHDPELRESLGRAGGESVLAQHRIEDSARELASHFRELQ